MRVHSFRVAAVVIGACALLVQPGAAQRTPTSGIAPALRGGAMSGGQAAAALAAADGGDPLELARAAARLGDDAVLALLAPDGGIAPALRGGAMAVQPASVRIAAVRAAPWLREPERALARIAAWVGGRDSELAPAAARAALLIARALDADALARREVAPAALSGALAALLHAAELAHVRQDLQRMAAAAAAQLVAAGVPAPAPERR